MRNLTRTNIIILFLIPYFTLIFVLLILLCKIIIFLFIFPLLDFLFLQNIILLDDYPNKQIILDENTPFETLWDTMVNSIYNGESFIKCKRKDTHLFLKYEQIPSINFTPQIMQEALRKGYTNEDLYQNMYNYLASIRSQKRGYLMNFELAVSCLSILNAYQSKLSLAYTMTAEDIKNIEYSLKMFGYDNYKLEERYVTINDMITVFTAAHNDFKYWYDNYTNATESNSRILQELNHYEYDWRLEDGYKNIKVNAKNNYGFSEIKSKSTILAAIFEKGDTNIFKE